MTVKLSDPDDEAAWKEAARRSGAESEQTINLSDLKVARQAMTRRVQPVTRHPWRRKELVQLTMGSHINDDGEFQSDKYPTTPAGKVPLSVYDTTAQDLLWEYAQRRRSVDAEFSSDLEASLLRAGYRNRHMTLATRLTARSQAPGQDGATSGDDGGASSDVPPQHPTSSADSHLK